MFVDAIVFCETSMLHPWLCRHYSLKRCQNTCHTRYQWLLGPFRGTFVINSEMSLKKKKKNTHLKLWFVCHFLVFVNIIIFEPASILINIFWGRIVRYFPTSTSPSPLRPWVELHHWITFLYFFFFFPLSVSCFVKAPATPFGVFQSWSFIVASVIVSISHHYFPAHQGSLLETKHCG